MNDVECHTLSAEGVRSYDYVRWKEETLAKQTSHKVTTPSLLNINTFGVWEEIRNQQEISWIKRNLKSQTK